VTKNSPENFFNGISEVADRKAEFWIGMLASEIKEERCPDYRGGKNSEGNGEP